MAKQIVDTARIIAEKFPSHQDIDELTTHAGFRSAEIYGEVDSVKTKARKLIRAAQRNSEQARLLESLVRLAPKQGILWRTSFSRMERGE